MRSHHLKSLRIYIFLIAYEYECFVFMHDYAPCVCAVLVEARRGRQIPSVLDSLIVVNSHVGAGNRTQAHHRQSCPSAPSLLGAMIHTLLISQAQAGEKDEGGIDPKHRPGLPRLLHGCCTYMNRAAHDSFATC